MFKKIISMVVVAITTAAICVTAMASSSAHGSVDIYQQEKYWRSFKAETTYLAGTAEIYAGIQCLRLDTGAAASENLLQKKKMQLMCMQPYPLTTHHIRCRFALSVLIRLTKTVKCFLKSTINPMRIKYF